MLLAYLAESFGIEELVELPDDEDDENVGDDVGSVVYRAPAVP